MLRYRELAKQLLGFTKETEQLVQHANDLAAAPSDIETKQQRVEAIRRELGAAESDLQAARQAREARVAAYHAERERLAAREAGLYSTMAAMMSAFQAGETALAEIDRTAGEMARATGAVAAAPPSDDLERAPGDDQPVAPNPTHDGAAMGGNVEPRREGAVVSLMRRVGLLRPQEDASSRPPQVSPPPQTAVQNQSHRPLAAGEQVFVIR